ncbi:MAG: hypothetical protein H7296_03455 [Bacteroidia bacterium]|nr:hypothetical protein [Bacteroidia bacterium]
MVQIAKIKNDTLKIEEHITAYKIKADGSMVCVWAPHGFYLNDKLLHTGVDALQLFKSNEGWKIIQICDTRKTK